MKLEKLEQRLYKAIRDIKDASGPREMMDYIRLYGRLEEKYIEMTGTRFNPAREHASLQDVEWRD